MGSPKIPAPVSGPGANSAEVQAAADQERQRQALAQGRQSTILGGLSQQQAGQTAKKSLLGA